MMSYAEVLVTLQLEAEEVGRWIGRHWVRPLRQEEDYFFDDCDVARLQLIRDLRDLAVGEDAVAVMLSLIDQLYDTRAALRRLGEALDVLPDEMLAQVMTELARRR